MFDTSVPSQGPFVVIAVVEHTVGFGQILVASLVVAKDIVTIDCNPSAAILKILFTVASASSFVNIVRC